MIQKFFPLDKNYLLEEAQLCQQEPLLLSLIEKMKEQYEICNNPLRLYDTFFTKIKTFRPTDITPLLPFYKTLAGIYRYKFGNNQLDFLWDGDSHLDKYKSEWSRTFDSWTDQFCEREQFIQAILDLTVFLPHNTHIHLAENRMNFVMLTFFEVKIHKTKGIISM